MTDYVVLFCYFTILLFCSTLSASGLSLLQVDEESRTEQTKPPAMYMICLCCVAVRLSLLCSEFTLQIIWVSQLNNGITALVSPVNCEAMYAVLCFNSTLRTSK